MTPDCVFCDPDRLPEKRESFTVLYRGFWVFEPLNPVTPGHLLVVPAKHVTDAKVAPYTAGLAMQLAAEVAQRYESANIITSIGTPATQSVFHLHVHVVPRTEGDGLHLPWTGQAERQRRALLDGLAEADLCPECRGTDPDGCARCITEAQAMLEAGPALPR